jgi:hypothetical protein
MQSRIVINELGNISKQRVSTSTYRRGNPIELVDNNYILEILAAEGCENFANYIEWLGFIKDPNTIVLSSKRHYYYEEEDLKNVNTVVNLKLLNQIKNLNSLFQTIFNIFPPKSNFIGCFEENNKNQKFLANNSSSVDGSDDDLDVFENWVISKIPFLTMIYNFMDSKTNRYMTRRNVYSLFKTHGFNILDMTELDGLTYFLARKVQIVVD